MKNHILYFANPNQINILAEPIPSPKEDEVLIQTVISGISAGTEMLFYNGLMPKNITMDSTIPSLKQKIQYPFKYGYCSVGHVIEVGHKNLKKLLNQRVFVFNPHESYFCAKETDVILLPEDISPYDALFIPNMETAINFLLDGSPIIGENVLVLGLGIVGLLTTALLKQFPLTTLIGIDFHEKRREICHALGATFTFNAAEIDLDIKLKECLNQNHADLIYELTGSPDALNSAIDFACYEGRIVLGSWYGRKPGLIDLGGKFHRNRIKLIPSQVSTIASGLHGRWTKNRRLDVVFNMLRQIQPARFISHEFHITEANEAYQLLQHNPQDALQVVLSYKE